MRSLPDKILHLGSAFIPEDTRCSLAIISTLQTASVLQGGMAVSVCVCVWIPERASPHLRGPHKAECMRIHRMVLRKGAVFAVAAGWSFRVVSQKPDNKAK